MAGILSGLTSLGLEDLENTCIFEEEHAAHTAQKKVAKPLPEVEEKDLIYDRSFICPVCDSKYTSKVMKSGKAKLLSTDIDLRAKYEGIDAMKYDVHVCPKCGYAVLTHYYQPLINAQIRMIKESICNKVKIHIPEGETYTYEEVIERYKLALACAVVKHGKDSEKAYICLHLAWLLRGYGEEIEKANDPDKILEEIRQQEKDCLKNAFDGLLSARQKETMPICGMDQSTLDYLLAALAYLLREDTVAAKVISDILTSGVANSRTKDKARELKELLLARHRK